MHSGFRVALYLIFPIIKQPRPLRFQEWELRALLGEHLHLHLQPLVALSLLSPQAGCEGVTLCSLRGLLCLGLEMGATCWCFEISAYEPNL